MQYEEFVELLEKEGLPLKATAELLYVHKPGVPAHVLVKYAPDKSGEDVLMCYLESLDTKAGIPLDDVTPEQAREFAIKWKKAYT